MVMSKVTRPATPPSFAALVQTFFAEHLTQQRALSPCTVAAYRDAFVLFLDFAQTRLGKSPVVITLADITPELVLAFLDHLEHERHNTVRSRNARLAALRAFLKFAGHRDVSSLHVIERVLGVLCIMAGSAICPTAGLWKRNSEIRRRTQRPLRSNPSGSYGSKG